MSNPIYLDNHATTPVDPRVLEVMLPYFGEKFGNPASRTHQFGWDAEAAVDKARGQVAKAIGAHPKEIVFTSGATEANNLAIRGVAEGYQHEGNHIITAKTEHKAVLDTCQSLERRGFEVTYLPVDSMGMVSMEQLEAAITDRTILVSIMHANNEIGTIQPIQTIGAICRDRGVLFHTDAAQSLGKISFDAAVEHVDLASFSAHKVYGPKGVGGLFVRRTRPRIAVKSQIDGGGHERGMRSGTLPVPLVVGLGQACELAMNDLKAEAQRVEQLRKRLWKGLNERLTHIKLNGHPEDRLPGNLNVSFGCVEGEALLMSMEHIAVSSGSACTSDTLEPSYVLKALGVRDELAHSAIRFGIGRFNTEDEIDTTIEVVTGAVERLRELSPVWEMIVNGEDPESVSWTPAR